MAQDVALFFCFSFSRHINQEDKQMSTTRILITEPFKTWRGGNCGRPRVCNIMCETSEYGTGTNWFRIGLVHLSLDCLTRKSFIICRNVLQGWRILMIQRDYSITKSEVQDTDVFAAPNKAIDKILCIRLVSRPIVTQFPPWRTSFLLCSFNLLRSE